MRRLAVVRLEARAPELLLAGAGLLCLAWWVASVHAADSFQRNATRAIESEGAASIAVAPGTPAGGELPVPADAATPALVGRIEIPTAEISAIIAEGADARTLRLAIGHLPGSALPGSPGRSVLAGHRDTFFRRLGRVRPGDPIRVTTAAGSFRYRVVATHIVSPRAVQVTRTGPNPGLILITCYPFQFLGAAPLRFVVVAAQTGREPRPARTSGEPDSGTLTAGARGAAG